MQDQRMSKHTATDKIERRPKKRKTTKNMVRRGWRGFKYWE